MRYFNVCAILVALLVCLAISCTDAFIQTQIFQMPKIDYVDNEIMEQILLNQTTQEVIHINALKAVEDYLEKTREEQKQVMDNEDPIQDMTGTCRLFNQPGSEYELLDQQSGCENVIKAGSRIFMLQSDPLTQLMTLKAGLFPLNGLFNQECVLPMQTYFCNMVYAPCITIPMPVENPETGETITVDADIPLLPCEAEYKEAILYPSCPVVAMMGIIDTFPFAPTGQCQAGLKPANRYTPSITHPDARVLTFPEYECPAPLATIKDPSTYHFSTLLSGPCSLPCPSFLFTKEDREWRDRFAIGWHIPSMTMGFILMFSYWFIPILRSRTFIAIATTVIVLQEIFIFFPLVDQLRKGGFGSGPEALCTGPASEVDGNNFLCGIQGWLGSYAMFGSLLPVLFLSLSLLEKIVFAQKIHLTPEQQVLKHRLQVAFALIFPGIIAIVEHSYGQINGNQALGTACGLGLGRDVVSNVNLSDGFGMILAAIFVFSSLIILLWVFFYLVWMRVAHNLSLSSAVTFAQFRIMTLATVMCSLYMVMFAFRLCMHLWIEDKMGVSIGEWITCKLTTLGTTCGEKPSYTIPYQWSNYILYIASSGGFTFWFAVSYTNDIWYGWAALIYYYFGQSRNWVWLMPYAKRGGFDQMVEDADKAARTTRRKLEKSQTQPNNAYKDHNSRTTSGNYSINTSDNNTANNGTIVSTNTNTTTSGVLSPQSTAKRGTMFRKTTAYQQQATTSTSVGTSAVEMQSPSSRTSDAFDPSSPTDNGEDNNNNTFSLGPPAIMEVNEDEI